MPLLFILSNERMVLKSVIYILKWNTWILAHYMHAVSEDISKGYNIKKDTQRKLYNACAIRALSSILDNNVDI